MNRQGITVLDGGMGKHLERSGAPFRQPEWSALALLDDPDAVRDAHTAFIEAGAQLIIANTYAVVPFHLGDDRFAERGYELAALAGRLAREAADAANRPIIVAGSLPPLFGSYEPENFDPDRAPAMYRTLVDAQAPYVDLWIAETVSSIAEAETIATAVEQGHGTHELWISFTVPDELDIEQMTLRSGESITDAATTVADRCDAILFNCSPPENITRALAQLRDAVEGLGVRIGGYANAFEPKPEVYSANSVVLDARDELTPQRYADIMAEWVDMGATIVGGCCHIHTEHIDELARRFA